MDDLSTTFRGTNPHVITDNYKRIACIVKFEFASCLEATTRFFGVSVNINVFFPLENHIVRIHQVFTSKYNCPVYKSRSTTALKASLARCLFYLRLVSWSAKHDNYTFISLDIYFSISNYNLFNLLILNLNAHFIKKLYKHS